MHTALNWIMPCRIHLEICILSCPYDVDVEDWDYYSRRFLIRSRVRSDSFWVLFEYWVLKILLPLLGQFPLAYRCYRPLFNCLPGTECDSTIRVENSRGFR